MTKKCKCCGNCRRWIAKTRECAYLEYHPDNPTRMITHTPKGFCCYQWGAKQKPNTIIGIDVELNGVPEIESALKCINELMENLVDTSTRIGNAWQAFGDALSEE